MTAPTNSPADLDLPSLDTSPACECDPDCNRHRGETCSSPADFVVRMAHMLSAPDCRPIPMLLCMPCLVDVARSFRRSIDACAPLACCCNCDQPIHCVHDFITAVVLL